MSQRAVERALGKMVTDPGFRERFFADPGAASLAAGLDLAPAEIDALSSVPRRALCLLEQSLDDRICRLALPPQ